MTTSVEVALDRSVWLTSTTCLSASVLPHSLTSPMPADLSRPRMTGEPRHRHRSPHLPPTGLRCISSYPLVLRLVKNLAVTPRALARPKVAAPAHTSAPQRLLAQVVRVVNKLAHVARQTLAERKVWARPPRWRRHRTVPRPVVQVVRVMDQRAPVAPRALVAGKVGARHGAERYRSAGHLLCRVRSYEFWGRGGRSTRLRADTPGESCGTGRQTISPGPSPSWSDAWEWAACWPGLPGASQRRAGLQG